MRKRVVQKTVVWLLLISWLAVLSPAEGLARPRQDRHKEDRLIIHVVQVNGRHMRYVRQNRLTLRDVIVAKAIADGSRRLDTEDVLRLHKRGLSYRKIAKRYHVSWRGVERRLNDVHKDLRREAVKMGLVMWALDEILD